MRQKPNRKKLTMQTQEHFIGHRVWSRRVSQPNLFVDLNLPFTTSTDIAINVSRYSRKCLHCVRVSKVFAVACVRCSYQFMPSVRSYAANSDEDSLICWSCVKFIFENNIIISQLFSPALPCSSANVHRLIWKFRFLLRMPTVCAPKMRMSLGIFTWCVCLLLDCGILCRMNEKTKNAKWNENEWKWKANGKDVENFLSSIPGRNECIK